MVVRNISSIRISKIMKSLAINVYFVKPNVQPAVKSMKALNFTNALVRKQFKVREILGFGQDSSKPECSIASYRI